MATTKEILAALAPIGENIAGYYRQKKDDERTAAADARAAEQHALSMRKGNIDVAESEDQFGFNKQARASELSSAAEKAAKEKDFSDTLKIYADTASQYKQLQDDPNADKATLNATRAKLNELTNTLAAKKSVFEQNPDEAMKPSLYSTESAQLAKAADEAEKKKMGLQKFGLEQKKTTADIAKTWADVSESKARAAALSAPKPTRADLPMAQRSPEVAKKGMLELETIGTALAKQKKLTQSYKPEYGGRGVMGVGANLLQKYENLTANEPNELARSDWWKQYNELETARRSDVFGASLTKGEMDAWDATTVGPGASPELIAQVVKRRQEILERAASRKGKIWATSGIDPDIIDLNLGTSDWRSYQPGDDAKPFSWEQNKPQGMDARAAAKAKAYGTQNAQSSTAVNPMDFLK